MVSGSEWTHAYPRELATFPLQQKCSVERVLEQFGRSIRRRCTDSRQLAQTDAEHLA